MYIFAASGFHGKCFITVDSVIGVLIEHAFRVACFTEIYKILYSGKFYPRWLWQGILKAVFDEYTDPGSSAADGSIRGIKCNPVCLPTGMRAPLIN